jgi:hypothetical protein
VTFLIKQGQVPRSFLREFICRKLFEKRKTVSYFITADVVMRRNDERGTTVKSCDDFFILVEGGSRAVREGGRRRWCRFNASVSV